MKTVITYGTFDLFHHGHVRLLKRARKLGDKLLVGLSTDDFNEVKRKCSAMSYKERKEVLEELECVDLVFPENNWDQKESDIQKYNIDIFVMGSDWKGKFGHLQDKCQVIYLPRTPDISTTIVKRVITS